MPTKEKELARQELRKRREMAKWGMVASMGTCVLTGMLGGKTNKKLHVTSGVAFLGMAYWHTTLYAQHPVKSRLPEPGDALQKRKPGSSCEGSRIVAYKGHKSI